MKPLWLPNGQVPAMLQPSVFEKSLLMSMGWQQTGSQILSSSASAAKRGDQLWGASSLTPALELPTRRKKAKGKKR